MASKVELRMIFPKGAFGAGSDDTELERFLRRVSVHFSKDPDGEWAEKYGADYEDGTILIHPYCWCGKRDCAWCTGRAPNFWHKPSGFKVWWYKYIGRDMETAGEQPDLTVLLRELTKRRRSVVIGTFRVLNDAGEELGNV